MTLVERRDPVERRGPRQTRRESGRAAAEEVAACPAGARRPRRRLRVGVKRFGRAGRLAGSSSTRPVSLLIQRRLVRRSIGCSPFCRESEEREPTPSEKPKAR